MVKAKNIGELRLCLEEQIEGLYWRAYARGKADGEEIGYARGVNERLYRESHAEEVKG